ncbi:MAG TPA: hypothetical protein VLJ79_00100 [Candidatus Binatia bacterium]|nr:hypothetical protein [Candidatus Binatia bacterium]
MAKNKKGEIMKISTLLRKLPVFMVICALGLTASSAFSQEKGKAKAKGKQKTETNGKHGREAGELPYGLERHTEKKGELPSGLQNKKDEDGQLTRGLEKGGKNLTSTSKGGKGSK